MLRNTSEAFATFYNFNTQAELQLRCKNKNIQSDWVVNIEHLLIF